MDVFTLLKNDHDKVSKLLEKVGETTERAEKTRTELFAEIRSELIKHSKAEEELFYPRLKELDVGELRPQTLEAEEEHTVVERLLKELSAMPVDSEEWTAKFTVLKENVEHHVKEEEGEMFKAAKKALSKEEAEELAVEIEQFKESFDDSLLQKFIGRIA